MTIRTNSLIKFNKIFFSNIPITASDEKNSEEKINIDYIESGVFEILKNSPKCKQDKLSRIASLEDLGFDSLDVVELVIAVEEKFNISISGNITFNRLDDDSVKIQTVHDMIQMFYNYHTGKNKKPEAAQQPAKI